MELAFLGAARTVTGSCYLLAVGDRRIMVDCGLYQGPPEMEEKNYMHPPVDWTEVDAILLTHAHIDHCGLIPKGVKHGFRGPIYTHSATIDLAEIMLRDSAEIHAQDASWLNRKRRRAGKPPVEPLFNMEDALEALKLFSPVKYGDRFEVVPGINAEFRDVGHILGSACIAVDCEESGLQRRIVFSGDVGNHQAPILREPDGFSEADAVLVETTYGNRVHESPEDRWEILKGIVQDAYANRAKVVIPSFAVGRTQELLYILGEMMHRDEIPAISIFLDSPMAIAATEVHEDHPEVFDKETLERIRKGDNPFHPVSLTFSRTVQESRKINYHDGAAIIIAGGGMCEGGRIVHHLKHNVYQAQNYLVFVGYQAEGTLGRVILNGKKKLRLLGEEVMVNAQIVRIDSFSAHADQNGLIDWLEKFEKPPQAVFLVHGEEKAGQDFGEVVREKLGFMAYQPRINQQVDLGRLEDVAVDKRRFIDRRHPSAEDVGEIVAKVTMQGEEFRESIESYLAILGERIRKSKEEGLEPHWRTEDVSDILEHLSKLIGSDVDQMKEVMQPDSSG